MLHQAVEATAQVKDLGDKVDAIEAKAKKAHILSIIGAVLFVVPYLRELGADAAGLTRLARIAAIAGWAAYGALGIYGITDDKSSALLTIFVMLVGVGGGGDEARSATGFATMASKKRFISADDVIKIGGMVKVQSAGESEVDEGDV